MPIYMTLGIIPTSFEYKAIQWVTVKINGAIAVHYCIPEKSCSEDWYLCADQMNVFDFLNSSIGGTLNVEVRAFNVESGPCDYNGYPLYAKMTLSETYVTPPKDPEEVHIMAIVAPIVAVILFLILIYVVDKVVAYKKANNKYSVRQEDVEKGMESIDPDEEASKYRNKPQSDAMRTLQKQWTLQNQAKVVPFDEEICEVNDNDSM